jgi:structural maintenance of chromosome 2
MVEEATGVSMYEAKKKSTSTMIEKKDFALKNIDALINETIVPKLDQLKKEQSGLMEYQKVIAELEALTKVYVAFTFLKEEENCHKASNKIDEKNNEIENNRKAITEAETKAQEIATNIKTLEKKKDEEFGGHLTKLEEKLKSEQMSEAKLSGELNFKIESLNEEKKKMEMIYKNLEGDKRITASKQKEYEKLKERVDKYVSDNETNENNLKKAEKDFEAISAGLSRAADGEAAATLADQLMTAKNEIANAETDMKKAVMKIKHSKSELTKKETESKKQKNTYDKDINEIEAMDSDVEKLRVELQKIGFDENKYSDLRNSCSQTKRQIDHLKDQISSAESQISRTRFDYKDPHQNFDRTKVIGVVCNLFKLKSLDCALAIEKAVGGKLYNVIVKDEETGKAIIKNGQLRERRTLIPLDKINGSDTDPRALKAAQHLVGKENVDYAINLVQYDSRLTQAMKYAFGDTMICPNMDIAKKVAFAEGVRKRTVTYDGEVFDPSGTLSGGAKAHGLQLLVKVAEIAEKREQLETLQNQLNGMENEFRRLETDFKRFESLKQKFDLRERETELVRQRLQQGNQHILMQDIEELKKVIKDEENVLSNCEKIKKSAEKRVQELQTKLKDSKSIREREMKEAEQSLNQARKQVEKSRKLLLEDQQKVECLELEIQELSKAALSCEEQIKEFQININQLQTEVETFQQQLNEVKKEVAKANEKVKEHKKLLKTHSDEISKMIKQKEALLKSAEEKELQIKQIKFDIDKIKSSSHDSAQNVKHMKKKYSWIEQERHLFGNENAGYGFNKSDFNANEVNRRVERLKSTKASLAKTVNMRANIMLSDKEKESQELSRKRLIIATDRKKLIEYMDEVDNKKKDALNEAWKKINTDFGSIFSTFLPNSNARLVAPEGKTVLDGLEVKVAFGDVWKESLTELSGGQRSLVALSLILALLKFNPAPLYILDEVDAALDQSHTQNTGIMIRKHFRNSQVLNSFIFIILLLLKTNNLFNS